MRGLKLNAAEGFPFPFPENAYELMWNHKLKNKTIGGVRYNNQFVPTADGAYQVTVGTFGIGNRPGRFDVTIEIPSPDEPTRREFFRRKLPGIAATAIDAVARSLAYCSFAHLHEVLRLSGLYAIHAGRAERNDEDLSRAARDVAASHESAVDGFRPKLEVPFGLQHLQALREKEQ